MGYRRAEVGNLSRHFLWLNSPSNASVRAHIDAGGGGITLVEVYELP